MEATDNAIKKAPGTDRKARMVLSISSLPHLVRSGDCSKYKCDSTVCSCPHVRSALIA